MSKPVFLISDGPGLDSYEAAAWRGRLACAARDLMALAPHHSELKPEVSKHPKKVTPNLIRHATFYGSADIPADNRSNRMRVFVGYRPEYDMDVVELHFMPGYDHMPITIAEPIIEGLDNAIRPNAPAEEIRPILDRLLGWLDHIILPIQSPLRREMEQTLGPVVEAFFELIRDHGYDEANLSFNLYAKAPYSLSRLVMDRPDQSAKPALDVLTPTGRQALSDALPILLRLAHLRRGDSTEIMIRPWSFEGEFMTAMPPVADRLKALALIPAPAVADLVIPFNNLDLG